MSQSSAQRRRSALSAAASAVRAATIPYRPAVEEAVAASGGTQVARLTREVYLNFEKSIPLVGSRPETDGQAQWLAGAEYVLRRLRTEIVLGE